MMAEIVEFATGVFLGVVCFFVPYLVYLNFKDRSERKRSRETRAEDEKFLENLPRRSFPNAMVQIGRNEAKYDSNGDLVWDSVRGCVGPATWID